MEYVDGTDVHELLKKKANFLNDALEIIQEIALALQHAHGKGFLHRDIKPRNIMITKAGVAKLADLGLARHVDDTETAEAEKNKAFGTPFYISPEQIRGQDGYRRPGRHLRTGCDLLSHGDRQGSLHRSQPQRSHEGPPQRRVGATGPPEFRTEFWVRRSSNTCWPDGSRTGTHSADDLLIDLELVMQGLPPKFHRSGLDASVLAETAAAAAAATAIPTQVAKPAVASAPDLDDRRFGGQPVRELCCCSSCTC